MGRGKQQLGAEDASPTLMCSICSCHHPHKASAISLAHSCLGWTRSELLLSLPQLPDDKGGMSGGVLGRLSPCPWLKLWLLFVTKQLQPQPQ